MKKQNFKTTKNWKSKMAIASIILLLAISTPIAITPVNAGNYPTVARVDVVPDPVGLNQMILVEAWITPQPPLELNTGNGVPRQGYTFTFTKPNGNIQTFNRTSDGPGSAWLTYKPDQLGTWTLKFSWAGDADYAGSEVTKQFTVQQEYVPDRPAAAPLPDGYWQRPINGENREWYTLAGSWPMTGYSGAYNASMTDHNPYSKAPNSAHILWKKQLGAGGVMGGDNSATGNANGDSFVRTVSPIILAGRIYYLDVNNKIVCIDIRTGQELWRVPGPTSAGFPSIIGYISSAALAGSQGSPYILSLAPTLERWDAFTGEKLYAMPGTTYVGLFPYLIGSYAYSQPNFSLITAQLGQTHTNLIKWSVEGNANFSQRIVYNVSLGNPTDNYDVMWFSDDVGIGGIPTPYIQAPKTMNQYPTLCGVNLTTGQIMWTKQNPMAGGYVITFPGDGPCVAYGKLYFPSAYDAKWHAIDIYTGNEVWTSEAGELPWGAFWAYNSAAAYNKIYGLSYDGHVYCYDANTGKTVWKFYSGDAGTETPYGTYPFYGNPAVADGKIYAGTSEHSPSQPLHRGNKLYCLDAENGKEIWNIAFEGQGSKIIGDGELIAVNYYDSQMYAFDKGQTATTVSVQNDVIAKGNTVLIKGTVMDQSPAQPNTPAISDADMSAWMEYLHMQKAKPTNATGVTVKLSAVDQNGNKVDIGTTTSDETGFYSAMWTPPSEGKWTITASFEGSTSYYDSLAKTAIGVTSAPATSIAPTTTATPSATEAPTATQSASPTVAPTPPGTTASVDMYIITAAVAVIIVVAAVAAVLLRRRK